MSTIILGHPFTNLHPGEPEVFPESNARQGRLVADLGPFAGLLKDPAHLNLEPHGEFGGSKEFVVIDDGHGSFKTPTEDPRTDW
jgi:hypothetical protein